MNVNVNFSPKPFKRRDPVRALSYFINFLLCSGVIVMGFYYFTLERNHSEQSEAFSRIEMRKTLLKEQYQSVVKELSSLDLRSYNRELKFYSSIQQEMSIPWTKVMDQLGVMIPDGVRIQKMASVESSSSSDSQPLQFLAIARAKKDQLVFLSALRDHPAFDEVLLKSEVYEGLQLQFEFTLQYAAPSDETISDSDGGEK